MSDILIAVVGYTIWGIVDYINSRLIFDKFHKIESQKNREYNYFWMIYYVLITYAYCTIKHLIPNDTQNMIYSIAYILSYLLFYLRMVPFLWSKYGVSIRIPAIYLFYEVFVSVLSMNISVIIFNFSMIEQDVLLVDDLLEMVGAVVVCIVLSILYYLKHSKKLNIWLISMTTGEYGLMILTLYTVGSLETILYKANSFGHWSNILKALISIAMFSIMFLLMRMILNKGEMTSMEVIISILEEQMGKLTEYYRELNKKDEELRKFRHDTKNMLYALQVMIKEGKNDQAVDYMEKMGAMYQQTARLYDTGNFIADALLNAKFQEAEKVNTEIVLNGSIPAEKINDVDMVILLSNLLDNAIEACSQIVGNKKIVIDSALGKQMWCIEVRNPVKRNITIIKNHIDTSKENKATHGYGLMNIERVTKHYNGILKLICMNKEFIAKATFVFEEKKD